MQRFGIKGKLSPRYIGPYEIIEECGPVAYRLRLPSQLTAIHDVFHVSQLKRCIRVPTEVIDQQKISVELDLSYSEEPLKILDIKERSTRRKVVKCIKFSGIITLKKKPPGRPRIISNDIILIFLNLPQVSSYHFSLLSNLGTRFFLRG